MRVSHTCHTANFIINHPNINNPLLDINKLLNEVTDFRILEDARIANDSVNTAITNYKRALTYLIFEDFRKQYACIKMLAAEGLQEAMQIWAVMRTVWDHLRGLRGTMYEIKTVETHNYASLQITEMY